MWLTAVLLGVAWMALTGEFTPASLAFGVVLGAAIVRLLQPGFDGRLNLRKTGTLVRFVAFLVWELVLANVKVAGTVLLTPSRRLRPAIVAVPLDVTTDEEITTLANLITLTPGTLSLDVSHDRRVLYVHVITVADPEQFRQSIKQGFERLVRELYA